jgi:hypothetical protein
MRIDPRDFIMTPYLVCPKCGKQEYGVLSVSDTRCERVCLPIKEERKISAFAAEHPRALRLGARPEYDIHSAASLEKPS